MTTSGEWLDRVNALNPKRPATIAEDSQLFARGLSPAEAADEISRRPLTTAQLAAAKPRPLTEWEAAWRTEPPSYRLPPTADLERDPCPSAAPLLRYHRWIFPADCRPMWHVAAICHNCHAYAVLRLTNANAYTEEDGPNRREPNQ